MRKLCQLTVSCVLVMQSACVLNNGIKTSDDKSTKELTSRLGYAGCRLSNPLQVDDVLWHASVTGGLRVDEAKTLRQQIADRLKSGSEIRLFDCTKVTHGLAVGTTFIGAIHDGKIEQKWLDVILN